MVFTGVMDWSVMEESRGFSLSWRGIIKGLVLPPSLSVVIFLIWVSSSAWFSSHRMWGIMDNVCASFSLTSNVRCTCLVWNCATSLYVFCLALESWDYFNYYFFTLFLFCFFSPSFQFSAAGKWIQRSLVLVFHFIPEKEIMKIIRHALVVLIMKMTSKSERAGYIQKRLCCCSSAFHWANRPYSQAEEPP